MSEWQWIAFGLGLLALFGLGLWFYRVGRGQDPEQARRTFEPAVLQDTFLQAARASGKPRGLHWRSLEIIGEMTLVSEVTTRGLLGLVPVSIQFEALPESDMEGLPAVDQLKHATAVFEFRQQHWTTQGRVIFNLLPPDVLQHFGKQYRSI